MATSSVHRVWYSLTRVQQHDTTHVVDTTPLHEHPTLTHTHVGTACLSTALGATFWDRQILVPNEFLLQNLETALAGGWGGGGGGGGGGIGTAVTCQ